MRTILTHQSWQTQGADVLIIDGEKSLFEGSSLQLQAQKLIKKTTQASSRKKISFLFKLRHHISDTFRIYISEEDELVFSSNFSSNDDEGRKITFDYYCNNVDNPSKVIRLFKDDCGIAGMKPNQEDVLALEAFLKKYNRRKCFISFLRY